MLIFILTREQDFLEETNTFSAFGIMLRNYSNKHFYNFKRLSYYFHEKLSLIKNVSDAYFVIKCNKKINTSRLEKTGYISLIIRISEERDKNEKESTTFLS